MSEKNNKPSICYVAGKSGGHIIPCITRAQELIKRYPDFQVLFFSTTSDLDMQLLADNPAITQHIPLRLGNFPYRSIFGYPRFIWHFIRAFFVSFFKLRSTRPRQVITTGGYIAIPVCLAARMLRIPIELQLLDVIPGKAIQFLLPFAQVISICFEQSKKYLPADKCLLVNYPVRFGKQEKLMSVNDARAKLKLQPHRYTIFVLGGSQGSLFLNNLMREWIIANDQLHAQIQVIHQIGANETFDWKEFYASYKIPAFVFSYYHELNVCYRASDVVICRSGAGTLFEIEFFGVNCITIPLETKTTSHQKDNAAAFAIKHPHACTVLAQEDLAHTKHKLNKIILPKISTFNKTTYSGNHDQQDYPH